MNHFLVLFVLYLSSAAAGPREIALTFDDAPFGTTAFFESEARTKELIQKLKELKLPPVMIFSTPCRDDDHAVSFRQMKLYRDSGNVIASHTCTHPDLNVVGPGSYIKDIEKAEEILKPLFRGQKFFRYPFLREGKEVAVRDQVRSWLKEHQYRNGYVSVDTSDYLFTARMREAKKLGRPVDLKKLEPVFIRHILESMDFYGDLAEKTLGRSPKHVLLLHEMDATVFFLEPVVKAIRNHGWKIISAAEAYQDPMYLESPSNTHANNGIVAQLHMEKTGEKIGYRREIDLGVELDRLLGIPTQKGWVEKK